MHMNYVVINEKLIKASVVKRNHKDDKLRIITSM